MMIMIGDLGPIADFISPHGITHLIIHIGILSIMIIGTMIHGIIDILDITVMDGMDTLTMGITTGATTTITITTTMDITIIITGIHIEVVDIMHPIPTTEHIVPGPFLAALH